jgi:DNA topoisomerase-2
LFYNLHDYTKWKDSNCGGKGYTIKYFKGLGTSKNTDIKNYFTNIPRHLKRFREIDQSDSEDLDKVFSKKRATDRKDWLKNYSPENALTQQDIINMASEISISQFINYDFIEFSMYDNVRSIPCVIDGLKPGQRKILYTALHNNIKTDLKVAQFSADVAKLTEYRHGEQSLSETIIGMAQTFTGSNNINLLSPEGAFGSRYQNGKDAASPRYIYTKLNDITTKIFLSEDIDILSYQYEDGYKIEPVYYVPIIPQRLNYRN